MSEKCEARVYSRQDTHINVVVLSGEWKDNVYELSPLSYIAHNDLVYIVVNDKGTEADWASSE